jgi:hypothetical protein
VHEDEGPGCSRGRGRLRLETEQGADPVDGREILDVPHHPNGSPVDERLVDEEIETVLTGLERGAV